MSSKIKTEDIDKVMYSSEVASLMAMAIGRDERLDNAILSPQERETLLVNIDKDSVIKAEIIEKSKNIDVENKLKEFRAAINRKNKAKRRRINTVVAIISVAAAMIALSFVIIKDLRDPNNSLSDLTKESQEIAYYKYSKKPTVIFDDSERIILTEEKSTTIEEIVQGRTVVENDLVSEVEKVSEVTLITPEQLNQTITLDDGTTVVLNSCSELIFPSKFTGDKREVTLKGEAYFKVAKSDKPFIVNSGDSYVRVYGTSFNVNNRISDVVKTVLVEGSVAVGLGEELIMVKPNQMAIVDASDKDVKIEDVEVSNYVAWVEGYFEFIDTPFNGVIDELYNWYGVKLNFNQEDFKDVNLNMSFKKDITLLDALMKIKKAINISITLKEDAHEIERVYMKNE